MEKPISVAREELIYKIVSAINGCGLPPCVALEVMQALTREVEATARKQLEKDLAEWQKASEEKKEEEENG